MSVTEIWVQSSEFLMFIPASCWVTGTCAVDVNELATAPVE